LGISPNKTYNNLPENIIQEMPTTKMMKVILISDFSEANFISR
jgi:hypothetical protein